MLLKMAGIKIGKNAWIRPDISIIKTNIHMGDHCGINEGVLLDSNGCITIGDYSRIGPRSVIITATHEMEHSIPRRNGAKTTPLVVKPVVIERGCWVQSSVTINPGVTIKEGCVIGVGAVVTRSTEPNGFYGGVPAKRLRDLPTSG
jgi:maltose O-acetyltransferase